MSRESKLIKQVSPRLTPVGTEIILPNVSNVNPIARKDGYYFANYTSGSIVFVDTVKQLSEDNTGLFWDAANKRLGVGTTSPGSKLEVNSTAWVDNTDTDAFVVEFPTTTSGTTGAVRFGKMGGANEAVGFKFQQVSGTDRLLFRGSATPGAIVWSQPEVGAKLYMDIPGRSYIFSDTEIEPQSSENLGTNIKRWGALYSVNGFFSGNVGIGTTDAPTAKLEIIAPGGTVPLKFTQESTGSATIMVFANTNGNMGQMASIGALNFFSMGGVGSKGMGLFADNNFLYPEIYINTNGRVNIGGDRSPNQLLTVKGTNAQISIEEDDDEFIRIGVGETEGDAIIGWDDGTDLHLGLYSSPTDTTITTRMIIQSGGNVGINDETPSYKLDVNGTGRFVGFLYANAGMIAGGNVLASGQLSGDNLKIGKQSIYVMQTLTGAHEILDNSEDIYLCNDNVGGVGFTVTLPLALNNAGRILKFIKIDANATTITLDGNGDETINGAATNTHMQAQYQAITILCDGTQWFILNTQ